jgi:hypothetical protein
MPAAESNEYGKEKKMINKLFKVSVLVVTAVFLIGMGDSVLADDKWSVIGEREIKAVDQGVSIETDGRKIKKAKISVEQADVEITKLVFQYRMRRDDEFANLGVVKAGGQITPIDLPGRKAKLKSVTVEYKILGGKEAAVIKVWGLN